MDILYACCAGLDVHKETVVATVRRRQDNGKVQQHTRTYGTMTEQLLELADWLEAEGVTHLAMESTGVYWKPIWNLLEERFQIMLVNAQPSSTCPGVRPTSRTASGSRSYSSAACCGPASCHRRHSASCVS